MNNFNEFNLSEDILTAIDKLGYKIPSKVQSEVIPRALQGVDLIAKANTGSGKTAAFGIPICERINLEERKPQALVLTPTRELCVQVKEDISNLGRLRRVKCTAIFGKQPYEAQATALKQRTHVIVGTPGRTLDHIERGTMDLSKIKYLIIDEADEMLKLGFIEQVEAIINRVNKDRITMLFSATIPEEIMGICEKHMRKPEIVEIASSKITADNIKHVYYEIEESRKFDLLLDIFYVENPKSGIIFCSTKDKVGNITSRLKKQGIPCDALHGGMLQNERLSTINRFRRGEFMFLVTTDVAARGLDIQEITHIINYDVPMEKERYVHRTGRTARAGEKGAAITLVSHNEYRFFDAVEQYIGFKIENKELPTMEEILLSKDAFLNSIKAKPKLKKSKSADLNVDITKIYLGAGKKKKIRPVDIVGTITSIEGITPEDIGIIDIQDNISYVDILNRKGLIVLEALKYKKIKGKTVKAQKAEK